MAMLGYLKWSYTSLFGTNNMRHIDGHDYKDDPFDFSDELTL